MRGSDDGSSPRIHGVGDAWGSGPRIPEEPRREHRRFRHRPARRFGGIGLLRVFGLLSVLVTIGVLGVLASKVLSGMGDTTADVSTLAGPAAPSGAEQPGTASPQGSPGSTDAALVANCQIDLRTVQTAVNAYQAIHGSLPADQAALVDDVLLDEAADTVDYRIVGGEPVFEGAGQCTAVEPSSPTTTFGN